jgi:phage I-like protein
MEDRNANTGLWTKFKEWRAATLTNRPFFDELAPVIAKDLIADEDLKAIADKHGQVVSDLALAALTAGDENTRDRVEKLLADLKTPEPKEKEMSEVTDYMKALGLDETADPNKRIAKAMTAKDEQILALEEKVTDLNAKIKDAEKLDERIEELEKRDRERDVEVILTKAISSGRVAPAEKESLSELGVENVQLLKKVVASRAQGHFTSKERGHSGVGSRYSLEDPDLISLAKEYKGPDDLDPDSGKLHLAALEVLKVRGKANDYTVEDYLSAIDEAEKTLV